MSRILLIAVMFYSAHLYAQPTNTIQQNSDGNTESNIIITFPEELITIELNEVITHLEAIANNTSTNEDTEAREEERQQRSIDLQGKDLNEQRTMAAFTKGIFATALLANVIALFALRLVYLTFQSTREANNILSNTARKQLRAYVGFDNVVAADGQSSKTKPCNWWL